jgi:nitrite reductase (NADH) small subunit
MSEDRWIRVTAVDNLPLREGRAVRLGERELALFNLGGSILATDNRCPHQGGPLCDGIVTGESVVCPLHAWKVNLVSGSVERPTHGKDHCVATYPTRIEDGIVLVSFRSTGVSTPSSTRSPGEKLRSDEFSTPSPMPSIGRSSVEAA